MEYIEQPETSEEQLLTMQIKHLQREYEKVIEPYIKRLAEIRMIKYPPQVILSSIEYKKFLSDENIHKAQPDTE